MIRDRVELSHDRVQLSLNKGGASDIIYQKHTTQRSKNPLKTHHVTIQLYLRSLTNAPLQFGKLQDFWHLLIFHKDFVCLRAWLTWPCRMVWPDIIVYLISYCFLRYVHSIDSCMLQDSWRINSCLCNLAAGTRSQCQCSWKVCWLIFQYTRFQERGICLVEQTWPCRGGYVSPQRHIRGICLFLVIAPLMYLSSNNFCCPHPTMFPLPHLLPPPKKNKGKYSIRCTKYQIANCPSTRKICLF